MAPAARPGAAGRAPLAQPDEFGLIARWFAPLARDEPGAFGLTDDAAAIGLAAGRDLVVTADMLVADVHFRSADPADSIAEKLLAVNLSDLAAMGAEPRGYLLTLALPKAWAGDERTGWLDGFAGGLAAAQAEYRCPLLGGDTVGTGGPLTLSLTALGTVAEGRALRRSGARPGDEVWVSGAIGCAALGLAVLQGRLALEAGLAEAAIERYRRPRPRLSLGSALVGAASACADVSDGLVADLGHICRASGVEATIDAARVPLSAAGRAAVAADLARVAQLLCAGDDYELVFTAPPGHRPAVLAAAAAAAVPVTAIGAVTAAGRQGGAAGAPLVHVLDGQGQEMALATGGWRHF